MEKIKKAQISLLIGLGITILLLLMIIFLSIKESKIKESELQNTKKELFQLKKSNYLEFSEKCIDENFMFAINEYGFETQEIENYLKDNFITCINKYDDLEIDYDLSSLNVNVEDNEDIISVEITLNTKLKSEEIVDSIQTYNYDFSKISFKNLKLENNKLAFDTKIISKDENAILYLKKDISFSLNNNPVSQISIKVDKKPDFSFIVGNFIYELAPDGLKSDELMILKLKYQEDWLNFNGKTINPKKLRIAYLEENKKEWRFLPSIVNIEKKEIAIFTNHFSKYAIVYLESNTPIIEQKDNDVYIAGFYNGGIYSEEQATITQNIEKEDDTNQEKCSESNDFDYMSDINVKKSKEITLPYHETGCIDAYTSIIYEVKTELPINKIVVKTNKDIKVEKEKKDNKILVYLSSNKKIDYSIDLIEINAELTKLEYPVYDKNINARYCFADKKYSANAAEEKYIHAGTDIDAASYVIASCDAEIIDIWNSNVEMKCQNEQHTKIYKKNQPNEEPGVNYGATVILKCTEYPIYLLYMHLNPENLYIRNPDYPNDFRYYCLGNYVKKGEILGIASDSGDAKGIHLHFEVRSGKTEDYGIPPRKNAFNPALLDIFNGLEETYKTKHQKTIFNQNCFSTFAMTRGATEKELFPEFYS